MPAKTVCPSSAWTREYYEYDGHYRTGYTYLDIAPEPVPRTGSNTIPHSFIMLLLTAMASPVHHMKITACSHVWCAQGDAVHNPELFIKMNILEQP